jgi:hypothetical protein
MKKLIKQIICSFIAIVAVMGLTTGSAYAQPTLSTNRVVNHTGNQVVVALDNEVEADNTEASKGCATIVCRPGVQYYANPSECTSFCQCSNGVPPDFSQTLTKLGSKTAIMYTWQAFQHL